MTKSQVLARIHQVGLLPVLRASSVEQAIALSNAMEAGGVSIMEVTMTVPGAIEVIRRLVHDAGDRLLIGAGTVLDPETARSCMLAGAQFIVSPSLNVKTIEMARRYSKPIFPGALTPTEVLTAWEAGADGVKIFPCSALGGASYIKALKGPFPQIEMVPTGGVNLETIGAFLKAGAVAVGVGGELIDNKSCVSGDYPAITARARKFREAARA